MSKWRDLIGSSIDEVKLTRMMACHRVKGMVCCCGSSQMDDWMGPNKTRCLLSHCSESAGVLMCESGWIKQEDSLQKGSHGGSNQAGLFMECFPHTSTMRKKKASSWGCQLHNAGIFSLTPLKGGRWREGGAGKGGTNLLRCQWSHGGPENNKDPEIVLLL